MAFGSVSSYEEDDARSSVSGGVHRGGKPKSAVPGRAEGKRGSNNDEEDHGSSMKKLAYTAWVTRKDKYDKAVSALKELNEERATDQKDWFETAVALATIDCQLKIGRTDACECTGICRIAEHAITRQRSKCQCPAVKCTICNRCIGTNKGTLTPKMQQVMEKYRESPEESTISIARRVTISGEGKFLNDKKISGADARVAADVTAQCSIASGENGTVLQRPCSCPMRSLADHWIKWTKAFHTFERAPISVEKAKTFAEGTRSLMEPQMKDDEIECYLMTVKWRVPAKAQKGDTAKIAARRQLSIDEKKQNALFLSLCRKHWSKAQQVMVQNLGKLVNKGAQKHNKSESKESSESRRSESKDEKAEEQPTEVPEVKISPERRAYLEQKALNVLGLKKLQGWIEEDLEAIEDQENEAKKERMREGGSAHEQWVRRKDRLRIRLPPEKKEKLGGSSKPPRFDFSSGKGLVRKNKVKILKTTVDFMKGSGAKYGHALSEHSDDLIKSRKQLIKKGFVHKTNFSKDEDDELNEERFEIEHRKTLNKKNPRTDASKAPFNKWLELKECKKKVIGYLKHISTPQQLDEEDDPDAIEAFAQWKRVGKALKEIDRTLLGEFMRWTGNYQSRGKCQMYWESFSPIACDIHSTSSAIRDTFLKLLHRRKINYKQAFIDFCDSKHSRVASMDDERKTKRYDSLSRKDFRELLLSIGIVLQKEETERLIDCFDSEGKGQISMKEFLGVIGEKRGAQCHGDTDEKLKDICMWDTVCHECGMANAFQLVGSKDNEGGRRRSELPDHAKRRQLKGFDCDPILNLRQLKEEAPIACEYSMWQTEDRQKALSKLQSWSHEKRDTLAFNKMVTKGSAPGAPKLFREDDDQLDPTRMLLLKWEPPRVTGNNGPAFYVLETSGAENSPSQLANSFKEIYRDPNDYNDNDGQPRYEFVITGLQPSTKYFYRIRAINGFGAGPYTCGSFTTCPDAPPAPEVVKLGSSMVTLSWKTTQQYFDKNLREMKLVFESMSDDQLVVSRDEFMEEVENRRPRVMAFLHRAQSVSDSDEHVTVLERIESEDKESLSWVELLQYFEDQRMVEESAVSENTFSSSKSIRKNRSGVKTRKQLTPCRYILKWCINEADGTYEEIYRGAKETYSVHNLQPAQTYQFRVQALNVENEPSLHSESTVVNTLLPTPVAPILIEHPRSHSVRLKWPKAIAKCEKKSLLKSEPHSSDLSASVDNLLAEWAHGKQAALSQEGQGSVNLQLKFDSYDYERSGFIELQEFKSLLEDLGINPSKDRLSAYLEKYDDNGDGRISFEEFQEWWHDPSVTYVVKRNTGSASTRSHFSSDTLDSSSSVVTYRGDDLSTVVSGLDPNTTYSFRLRHLSSHSNSHSSPVLTVTTAPAAPTAVGVVDVSATTASFRWYANAGGAATHILEAKFIETLEFSGRTCLVQPNKGDWHSIYEGRESLAFVQDLLPNSVYRIRAIAVNAAGERSDCSTAIQICTEEKSSGVLKPSNAAELFTIECGEDRDVVPGDTLLFTECIVDANHGGSSSASRYDPNSSTISSSTSGGGETIGERTIAARVLAIDSKTRSSSRTLSMNVIWSTVELYPENVVSDDENLSARHRRTAAKVRSSSVDRSSKYVLLKEAKIRRKEKSIFRYETFRRQWQNDEARHSSTWEN